MLTLLKREISTYDWFGGSHSRIANSSGWQGGIEGPLFSPNSTFSGEFAINVQEEESKLLDKVKQQALARMSESDFDFGEDVAELAKTLASLKQIMLEIRHVFTRLDDLVIHLRKKYGYSPQEAFRKAWLRIRYEVRPLVYSASNLVDLYNKGVKKQGVPRKRSRSKAAYAGNDSYQLLHGYYNVTRTRQVDIKCSAGVIFLDSAPPTTLDSLGLGLKDIVPTMWAITRFSFLIDKFLDISSTIEGLQNIADPRLRVLGGWTTSEVIISTTNVIDGYTRSGWTGSASGQNVIRTVSKSRAPWIPTYDSALPSMEWADNWETYMDIFTIFAPSTFRRR